MRPAADGRLAEPRIGVLAGVHAVAKSLQTKGLDKAGVPDSSENNDVMLEKTGPGELTQKTEQVPIAAMEEIEDAAVDEAVAPEIALDDASGVGGHGYSNMARLFSRGELAELLLDRSTNTGTRSHKRSESSSAAAGTVTTTVLPCPNMGLNAQAGLNCNLPQWCKNLTNESQIPEVQIAIQRVLEKCYEYHNTCQAAAHAYVAMAGKRRLLEAKINVSQSELKSATEQHRERLMRLVEKNHTIQLISEGVHKMNVTANELRGATMSVPPDESESKVKHARSDTT